MSGRGEIAGADDADDGIADLQIVADARLVHGDFRHIQPQCAGALGHERPSRAAAGHTVAVLLGVLAHPERGHTGISAQIDGDHRQTGRPAAGKSDDVAVIFPVAPTLVPLHQQRHRAAFGEIAQIHGWRLVLFQRIIQHELAGVLVALIKRNQFIRVRAHIKAVFSGVGAQIVHRTGRNGAFAMRQPLVYLRAAVRCAGEQHYGNDHSHEKQPRQEPPAGARSSSSHRFSNPPQRLLRLCPLIIQENRQQFLKNFLYFAYAFVISSQNCSERYVM